MGSGQSVQGIGKKSTVIPSPVGTCALTAVVSLMMPVYYCTDECKHDDIEIARESWSMIINNASPHFESKKGTPQYNFPNCVTLFYDTFYSRLFDVHPLAKQMFSISLKSLLVSMITMSLRDISGSIVASEDFTNRLLELAVSHNDRGVKAVEYGIVGEVLFWSLRYCLGNDIFDTSTQVAWIKVFSRMLKIIVPVAVDLELKSGSVAQSHRLKAVLPVGFGDLSPGRFGDGSWSKNHQGNFDVEYYP